MTGLKVNQLDPGIDAVRSSTERTQGHLHSTRVTGPDSSGYCIVTSFQCCGTLTTFCSSGSGSDFCQVTVPVPTFAKLRF